MLHLPRIPSGCLSSLATEHPLRLGHERRRAGPTPWSRAMGITASRTRSSAASAGLPAKASASSTRTRSHTSSCDVSHVGTMRSPVSRRKLSRRSWSILPPYVRAPGLARLGRDELVDERVLSGCWPEHPTDPLEVHSLSLAARDDDGDARDPPRWRDRSSPTRRRLYRGNAASSKAWGVVRAVARHFFTAQIAAQKK